MISLRVSLIGTISFCAAAFFGASCLAFDNTPLTGEWIECNGRYIQGFKLSAKSPSSRSGMAESIGTKTLCYSNWEVQGDKLILTGLSIGNRTSSEFKDTLKIGDILVNQRGNLSYHKIQHLSGTVRFADEQRCFTPSADTPYAGKQYWLIDPSGELLAEFVNSGEPVWEKELNCDAIFCDEWQKAEFADKYDGTLKLISLK